MNNLIIQLLVAILVNVVLCTAQDDPIDIDLAPIPPGEIPLPIIKYPIRTISPIIINPNILCFLFPLPARCNPCKFGQPLKDVPCEQGQGKCAAQNGACKINQYNRAYCCPNEHRGCCPSVTSRPILYESASQTDDLVLCIPRCTTDAQCPIYQKCCGSCRRCINATIT